MDYNEKHIFILWSKARPFEGEILADIAANFVITDTTEIEWPKWLFPWKLHKLYGKSFFSMFKKMRRSGGGKFLLVEVVDPAPLLDGKERNLNTIGAKGRYRKLTGGNWRIHASDTPKEAEENLACLRKK